MHSVGIASCICSLHFLILNVCKAPILAIMDSFSHQFSMDNYMLNFFWQIYSFLYNFFFSVHVDGLTAFAIFLIAFVLVSFVYVPEWILSLRHRLQK